MKTLFIGNSHTYFNDLPKIFTTICTAHGIGMKTEMLTRGGIGFEDHAADPQTRSKILEGHFDYVVLQHRAHPMGDLSAMHDGAAQLLLWVRQSGAHPVFYQTWAKKGDESYQPTMSRIYAELGKEFHVPVAPVGDRWQAERLAHPETELYFEDGEHASPAGSILAASVIFATIFPDQQ